MLVFRTMLFAADFSDSSKAAFRVASALAREGKTRVFVLHVPEPPLIVGDMGAPVPMYGLDPAMLSTLKERLRAEYTPNHPIDVEYHVREGMPVEEILDAAGQIDADLIVMGTHGRRGLGRLLAGSVAEAVMRQARCPVLALRQPAAEGAWSGVSDPVILHPTDFSERSAPALWVARALARDWGARLVLMHAAPPVALYEGGVVNMDAIDASREDLEAMRLGLVGDEMKHEPEAVFVQGDPAAEIPRAAEDLGAHLIVMGTHGRTGLGRLLMGSVAESTLRRAPCPVLAVKGPVASAYPPAPVPEGTSR